MTPGDLLSAAHWIAAHCPGGRIVKNAVGNLAIYNAAGAYVGHLDIVDGELELILDDADEAPPRTVLADLVDLQGIRERALEMSKHEAGFGGDVADYILGRRPRVR